MVENVDLKVRLSSGMYIIVATNVDFRIGSALKMYAPLSVRDYEQVYGLNNNDGTGVLSVHGTFKPAEHNYFYGCTMMDGSTIDLSCASPVASC